MAEETADGHEKTEDPTDERREEFRKQGDIALSKDLASIAVLIAVFVFICFYTNQAYLSLRKFFQTSFSILDQSENIFGSLDQFASLVWKQFIWIITPVCLIACVFAIFTTFMQTKMNVSFKKVSFDFKKINPISGFSRIISFSSIVELLKGLAKMIVTALLAYFILFGERYVIPSTLRLPLIRSSSYWFEITKTLFFSTAFFMFVIACIDYFYLFISLEKKMKMTKQEVKEDFKKREVDPMIKGRMKKMQRDLAMRRSIKKTKEATVIITNPTHFAVALKYELGMQAPQLIAKGIDFMALRMKEIAKEHDIPIVENKPLARAIYKTMEIGDLIPESFYKAVSEIIKYVFKLKGVRIPKRA